MECSPSHCALTQIIQAIVTLTETVPMHVVRNGNSVRKAVVRNGKVEYGAEKLDANAVQRLAFVARNEKVRTAALAAVPAFKKLIEAADCAVKSLQNICLACSRTSNDDNPSNHGQVFVSLDALAVNSLAGSPQPDSPNETVENADDDTAEAGATHSFDDSFFEDDDIADRSQSAATGDFIHRNAIQREKPSTGGSVSRLPYEVEDHLRKMLHSFSELSVLEQNLVLQMMHEGTNMSDFATMNWVPIEMRRRQSKQWVALKWQSIVNKFPVAAVLRKNAPIKNVSNERTRHYTAAQYDQMTFDFGGFLKEDEGEGT